MLLWNALNAGALYVALGMVLPRRAATVARAIVFLDMLGSLQNVQSNALVAALIIFTFAAYERRHTALGSLAAVGGAFIKALPARRRELRDLPSAQGARRRRRDARPACCAAAAAARHAAATLLAQYASWRAHQASEGRVKRGFSVMQMLRATCSRADWPNWPIQLLGVAVLVAPVLAAARSLARVGASADCISAPCSSSA